MENRNVKIIDNGLQSGPYIPTFEKVDFK